MADKKDEKGQGALGKTQPHDAVPVSEGADFAGDRKYAEMKDKPDPTTIAQVEVTDE